MSAVTDYFLGEKQQCMAGIVFSTVSIGLALYFLFQVKTELTKGIAWPFLIVSILLLAICVGVVWRTPHDIERVTNFIEHEKEKIESEEIPRMENVLRNFKIIKIVEIVLFLCGFGLLLYGYFKGNSLLTGVGIGLAIQSGLMFGFDFLAHHRGEEYFRFLQNFQV